jgi:hypothetical protein
LRLQAEANKRIKNDLFKQRLDRIEPAPDLLRLTSLFPAKPHWFLGLVAKTMAARDETRKRAQA